MSTKVQASYGTSFLSLLSLLFIGLKLGNVITWSWWWVLAPLWGPFAILAVVLIAISALAMFCANKKSKEHA